MVMLDGFCMISINYWLYQGKILTFFFGGQPDHQNQIISVPDMTLVTCLYDISCQIKGSRFRFSITHCYLYNREKVMLKK